MKKVKFTGKLSLNKETIAKLNNEQMSNINGGTGSACTGSRYCSLTCTDGCTPTTEITVTTC